MWIIPKNLDVSACVRDTLDSNWDSDELSQIYAQCVMWRGKDSLARTWSQRLKRVSWMQLLSGRILKPLMVDHFIRGYTSLLEVIPANRSVLPASEKGQMTPDTFGRILQESWRQLDLFGVSSRTSQDTLVLDSPKFIEAYDLWVTKLRQDCLQRRRSARHTRESGCLSWPTMRQADAHKVTYQYDNHSDKTKPRMTLCGLVKWPTPAYRDYKSQHAENSEAFQARQSNPRGVNLVEFMQRQNGLLAQDSPSTNGKNRGLWMTPQSSMIGSSIEINKVRMKRLKAEGRQIGGIQNLPQQVKGKLNPDWVEQLMGIPAGWTDCVCSETV